MSYVCSLANLLGAQKSPRSLRFNLRSSPIGRPKGLLVFRILNYDFHASDYICGQRLCSRPIRNPRLRVSYEKNFITALAASSALISTISASKVFVREPHL